MNNFLKVLIIILSKSKEYLELNFVRHAEHHSIKNKFIELDVTKK